MIFTKRSTFHLRQAPLSGRWQARPWCALLTALLLTALLLAACSGGGDDGGGDDTGSVAGTLPLTVLLPPSLTSGEFACSFGAGGVASVSIQVQASPFDPLASNLANGILTESEPGLYTGSITGTLPKGTPLDFLVRGYSELNLQGGVIFERTVTRTISGADATGILLDAVSQSIPPAASPPAVSSVKVPIAIASGSTDNLWFFRVDYGSEVKYKVTVVDGTLNGTGLKTISNILYSPGAVLPAFISYDAPGVAGRDFATIRVEDANDPAIFSEFKVPLDVAVDGAKTPQVGLLVMLKQVDIKSKANQIYFYVFHDSPVEFTITVTRGSSSANGTNIISGTYDPSGTPLLFEYDAPVSATPDDTITIDLVDATNPGIIGSASATIDLVDVAGGDSIDLTSTETEFTTNTSASVLTYFGPVIKELYLLARATNLISLRVVATAHDEASGEDTTLGLFYSWSGTGDFAGLSGTGDTVSFSPFDDLSEGDITVRVLDGKGIEAQTTFTINAGDYPLNVTVSCHLGEPLDAYDFFNDGTSIDTAKWIIGSPAATLVNGQATFSQSASGAPEFSDLTVKSGTVTAISAFVTLIDYSETSLSDPNSRGRARIGGFFYNDGSTGDGGGGQNGNIYAEIGINGKDELGLLGDVFYGVQRCMNADCTTRDFVSGGWVSLFAVATEYPATFFAKPHALYLAWDATGNKFTFQIDDNPPTLFDPVAAGASVVSADPVALTSGNAMIGTAFRLASGESGEITAKIDNVRATVAP